MPQIKTTAYRLGGIFENGHLEIGNWNVGPHLTLAAFVKAASFRIADARIISKAIGEQDQDHIWMISTMSQGSNIVLRFRLKTDTTKTWTANTARLQSNQWHHVAATYDGHSVRLWLDGHEVFSAPQTGDVAQSDAPIWIGNNPGSNRQPFHGRIDSVRIFDRPLTSEQIRILAAEIPEEENQPPIVNAGMDVNLTPSATIQMAGSASDPEGQQLEATWSKVEGPGNVAFSNLHDPQTNVTFTVPGRYVLRLTVSDGQHSVADDVAVDVLPLGS